MRGFYFLFVNSIQYEKGFATGRIYLILPLCLKFYVFSRFVYGPPSRIIILLLLPAKVIRLLLLYRNGR